MSTRPDGHGPALRYRADPASTIEAVADKLTALLEEFEPAIAEGQIPHEFGERLAQLRRTAERLVGR